MTTTTNRPPLAANGNGHAVATARRPLSASTKFTDSIITDPEATLHEQLQDDRLTELRADMGGRYVEDLQLPNYGDGWIPGYRVITEALAKEFGLAGFEDDPFEDLPLDQPQPESAAIDGNIVASFVDGVTGQHKHDVLNGCLLAQLAANVRFDRTTDPINWTKFYTRVLENIGWVVPSSDFRRLRSNQSRFTIDSAIIQVLTSLLTGDQLAVAKASLEALKELNDGDGRLAIFNRNAVNSNAGNFQVDNVGVSATGVLSMRLGAFSFKTNESVTKVLFFSFSSGSTLIQVLRNTLVLNEQVHERLRQPILDKLGNRGIDFIRGLDIGDV